MSLVSSYTRSCILTCSSVGALIVSTPQDVALIDARRGVAMFSKVEVPVWLFIVGVLIWLEVIINGNICSSKFLLFWGVSCTTTVELIVCTFLEGSHSRISPVILPYLHHDSVC